MADAPCAQLVEPPRMGKELASDAEMPTEKLNMHNAQ
jgi:hypothetical protein